MYSRSSYGVNTNSHTNWPEMDPINQIPITLQIRKLISTKHGTDMGTAQIRPLHFGQMKTRNSNESNHSTPGDGKIKEMNLYLLE